VLYDEAVAAFAEAATLEREHGASYYAACAELDLARAYEARGDAKVADATRQGAQALFDRIGCVNPI
jgi:hypothetical protein